MRIAGTRTLREENEMNRHAASRGLACILFLGVSTVTVVTAPAAEAHCPLPTSTTSGNSLHRICTPRDT